MLNEKSSDKIYRIKYILAIGIVIYHASLLNIYGYHKDNLPGVMLFLDNMADMFGEVGNTLFIVFASYFMFIKRNDYIQMLKKKIKGLLIPFIIWNVIGCILIHHCFVPINQLLKGILFSEYDGPLWFCSFLFLLALIYPLINTISDNKCMLYALILFLFIMRVTLATMYRSNSVLRRDINYVMWYLVGAWISKYHPKWLTTENDNKTSMIYLLILIFVTYLYGISDISDTVISVLRPMIVWQILNVSYEKDAERKELFNISFFVFASHYFLLGILKKLINHVGFTPSIDIVIVARYFAGGGIAVLSTMIGLALKNRMPKIYKTLCGR